MPEPTPTNNQWQRLHFRQRKRVCETFAWLIRSALGDVEKRHGSTPKRLDRCCIHVDRHEHHITKQRPDWDNLYGGLKPCLDALVVASRKNPHGLGLIVDDSPDHVLALTADSHICEPGAARTEITITEVAGRTRGTQTTNMR